MHRCLFLAIAFVATMSAVSPAWAAIVFEETFDYGAVDELAGQSGGAGLAGSWSASTDATQLTTATFDYTVADGGTILGGSGALQIAANGAGVGLNSPSLISRALATPFDGDEIYIRFLLTITGGTIDQADRVAVWLNSSTGPYAGVLPLNTGGDFIVRSKGDGPQELGGGDLEMNQTYLIVVRFSKTNPGAGHPFDRADLWVNPALDALDAPDLSTAQAAADPNNLLVTSITSVGIETVNVDADDVFILDALKAGTEWHDVVPLPEPATGAFIGAGLMLAAGSRYRRP